MATVLPGHGGPRPGMNAEAHCWKACWGQPLRSSNLLSSANSDQAIHQAGHEPERPRSLIHSTYIGIKRPKAGACLRMVSRLWPPTRQSSSRSACSSRRWNSWLPRGSVSGSCQGGHRGLIGRERFIRSPRRTPVCGLGAGWAAVGQAGGAKNSRAIPSGSRKETPEP